MSKNCFACFPGIENVRFLYSLPIFNFKCRRSAGSYYRNADSGSEICNLSIHTRCHWPFTSRIVRNYVSCTCNLFCLPGLSKNFFSINLPGNGWVILCGVCYCIVRWNRPVLSLPYHHCVRACTFSFSQ